MLTYANVCRYEELKQESVRVASRIMQSDDVENLRYTLGTPLTPSYTPLTQCREPQQGDRAHQPSYTPLLACLLHASAILNLSKEMEHINLRLLCISKFALPATDQVCK